MEMRKFGWSLFLGIVLALCSYNASAKPKLGPGGTCIVSTKCTNSIDATCAQLYCKALSKGCNGNYDSGDCKDIKELHDIGMCSLAKNECGSTLPTIIKVGGFSIEVIDDERFVIVDPGAVDDKNADHFKSIVEGASKAIRETERKGKTYNKSD